MPILRDYQTEDVGKILDEFKTVQSTIYVAATGLGKTVSMVKVAERMLPGRTIFMVHSGELVNQAVQAFERAGLTCEIEKAELVASTNLFTRSDVVVATVQTLQSGKDEWTRMKRFKPEDFSLLLYDEAHLSVAPGNKKIVRYFMDGNPNLKVLAVTATPQRLDKESLGQLYQTVAAERDICWAIDNGWLVPIDQQMVNVGTLDFSEVRTTAGDLNGADLAAVMEAESNVQSVVMATIEAMFSMAPNTLLKVPVRDWPDACKAFGSETPRRTIAFASSVKHAEMMSDILNRVKPGLCTWVCGETSKNDRPQIIEAFKAGEIPCIANVGVLVAGFDCPAVELIVNAAPTKSRTRYVQRIGRGTRPLPGIVDGLDTADARRTAIANSEKRSVLVIDFAGDSGRHKLVSVADVLGGKVSQAAVDRAVKKAKEQGAPVNMSELLEKSEEEIQAELLERKRAEEARKARLVAKASYTTTSINPFDVFQLQPVRERGWDAGKQLSERQRELLRRQNIDPDSMPYAQAKALMSELFRRWSSKLCTFKQAKLLQRHGYQTKDLTMKDATKLIDALAKNNWKRPVENQFMDNRRVLMI